MARPEISQWHKIDVYKRQDSATARAPMLPLAPGRFSTTTVDVYKRQARAGHQRPRLIPADPSFAAAPTRAPRCFVREAAKLLKIGGLQQEKIKGTTHMGFLAGKRILVTGVLSNRSIAYGIARACHQQGAELAFTYVGDRFKDRVAEFAAEFGSDIVLPCDVAEDSQIEATFTDLAKRWDGLDGLVHSIGFAPREAIAGNFLDGLSRCV